MASAEITTSSDNVIVIDTETTGLPTQTKYREFFTPSNYSKYNTSRVIEIGYYIYSKDGSFIKKQDMLIIPDKFKIENTEIHGIKHEDAELNGIPLFIALGQFGEDLKSCNTIVAHNLEFDFNVIQAECYRILANGANALARSIIEKMNGMKQICTIELAMEKLDRERKMRLVHLYEELKGIKWEQQHRAEDDARVCGECYWHLVNLDD